MTELVENLSRSSIAESETEDLKIVAMFCGAGLFVSLLLASWRLPSNLMPGGRRLTDSSAA
jgi:hypothetical protein